MVLPRSSMVANTASVHPAALVVCRLTDQYSIVLAGLLTMNSTPFDSSRSGGSKVRLLAWPSTIRRS